MEEFDCIQVKQKRARTNPPRKWNVAQENALIEFLLENSEMEKPTAQIYYKKFAVEKCVPVDWKLVRAKVRNMRVSYNKAKAWEGSTGAGSMEGETLKTTLTKMCRFFYELDDIFGRRSVDSALIEESLESDSPDIFNSTIIEYDDTAMSADSPCSDKLPSTSRKGIYSRTGVSDILKFQSEMLTLKKKKMEQELSVRERELEIKEKEVALKAKEIEVKEMEIRSQENCKILELQMQERVAMEELKLKYK